MIYATQKIKFSIKDFFNKCEEILRKLRIWPHLHVVQQDIITVITDL